MERCATRIFEDSRRTYGTRRLSRELKKAGFDAGRHQTRSVMAKLGLQPRYPKRFRVTTDSKHGESISPNLLDRQFDVAAPNQVWTTDINMDTTGKEVLVWPQLRLVNPSHDRFASLLGDFELNWAPGFLLHDNGSRGNAAPLINVADFQSYKIATPQLAVDG
jgi:hypothetical protein